MDVLRRLLRWWWVALVGAILAVLRRWFPFWPLSPVPRVDSFDPGDGWPGTRIVIKGTRFGAVRDDNLVTIGGVRALVLTASPTELEVMAGEKTVTGPIRVETTAGAGDSTDDFRVLPYPLVTDAGSVGAPRFFHGPMSGTPQVGVADQKVLVVFAYPMDDDPGTAAQRNAIRNSEIAKFGDARRFWVEATYTDTSWSFDFSDWLDLPGNRRDYFWTIDDIVEHRRNLLRRMVRAGALAGTVFYGGHQRNAFVRSDVVNPSAPSAGSAANLTSAVTGVSVIGSRAYVTAGADGLTVFDISGATPTSIGNRATTGWYHDVDAFGDVALVAAEAGGCEIWDLTNPDSPVLADTVAPGGWGSPTDWATTVHLVGTNAYVGGGRRFVVLDVSTPASTTVASNVAAGAWVMDIAVTGSLCAVATDGAGVELYDTAGAGAPAKQAAIQTVTRTNGVAISGSTLFIAAGNDGLLAFDVSTPTAPAHLGTLSLSGNVLDVVAGGTHVYASVGGRQLTVVDVANPASMSVEGTVSLAGSLAGSGDPDTATLRTNLANAIDGQALRKDDRIFVDAFQKADAVINLDPYVGLVVVVNGDFLRGQSFKTSSLSYSVGIFTVTFSFGDTKGVYYVATGAHWGRVAHETGHWLDMWDIYAETLNDGSIVAGTAAPWCMAGNHDSGPLWSGHQIQELMDVYEDASANDNVAERTWSPTAPALDEAFDIVAHDANEDTAVDRIHLVKLVVSSGLWYFVEVRQKPTGSIFDQNIPVTNPDDGIVVVTRVVAGTNISNALERPITLVGAIDVGEQVVDAARGLTIEVESIEQNRPLVYRVRVSWNQPVTEDPDGQFDLAITPWTTDHWETVDIWVDSPRNNLGSVEYENHEPGDVTKPILNGDRPWVHHDNAIHARIRNTGPVPVDDVYLTFYANSPPGIGDNGDWFPLATQHIPTVPGHDPAIPGSGEMVLQQEWKPAKGEHTCLKVAIMPRSGEIDVDNNHAQENVFTFDSAGSSSHDPVVLSTAIRSPFTVWRKIDAIVRGLPPGWHAVVGHAWVWAGPLSTHALDIVMWTDLNAPYDFTPPGIRKRYDNEWEIPDRALIRFEGWTDFDHRYVPIGGILADVRANQRVEIDWSVDVSATDVFVTGCLSPPLEDVPITVEVTDQSGRSVLLYGKTDKRGCFTVSTENRGHLEPGEHEVQVFVTAGGQAAESESEVRVTPVG